MPVGSGCCVEFCFPLQVGVLPTTDLPVFPVFEAVSPPIFSLLTGFPVFEAVLPPGFSLFLFFPLSLSSLRFHSVRYDSIIALVEDSKNRISVEQPRSILSWDPGILGAAIYFRPFIPDYAKKTRQLYAMTAKTFDWTRSTWTIDYEAVFESFKGDILNSFMLYHPDFKLD